MKKLDKKNMKAKLEYGFTMVEILIVIVIVGILAGMGVANFQKTKEATLNNEAAANLKLIQAAEKIYFMENSAYYAGNTAGINTNLRLALPTATKACWTYLTTTSGCSQSTSTTTSGFSPTKNWRYLITDVDDPTNGTCP